MTGDVAAHTTDGSWCQSTSTHCPIAFGSLPQSPEHSIEPLILHFKKLYGPEGITRLKEFKFAGILEQLGGAWMIPHFTRDGKGLDVIEYLIQSGAEISGLAN